MEVYQPDSDVKLDRAVFYLGAKWCGPCKIALPLYEAFAEDNSEDFEVTFYYIDIDDFSTQSTILKQQFDKVSKVPTLLCFLNGEMVEKISPWDQDKLYTAMHVHYVEGEPVDNSRYAVIPDRVPNLPELSSSDGEEIEFDIPTCDDGVCFEIEPFSIIAKDDVRPESTVEAIESKIDELTVE